MTTKVPQNTRANVQTIADSKVSKNYLKNENPTIKTCFKITVPEIKSKIKRRRKHKPANKLQSDTNFVDLSHTPEKNKK
jgi:hypothetical protein